jgi:hypothetical protein
LKELDGRRDLKAPSLPFKGFKGRVTVGDRAPVVFL